MAGFKKAERKQVKLKIALTGPSGSGKTYSALLLAQGLGGKVAVMDTENGSAALYSDRFDFDTMELSPPYTVEKYINGMKDAMASGYNVLIMDSISHQWKGEGGILSKKEQLDGRGGNSFTNWAKLTPEQEKFMAAILHSDIHMICTMRSKQEYALSDGDNGKLKVQKLGLAPIQREGMEYEFTTVLDLAMNNEAEASKDRTGLFFGKIFKITEETGKTFMNWVMSGKEVPWQAGPKEMASLQAVIKDKKRANPWTSQQVTAYMMVKFNKQKLGDFTKPEYEELMSAVVSKDPLQAIKYANDPSPQPPASVFPASGPVGTGVVTAVDQERFEEAGVML